MSTDAVYTLTIPNWRPPCLNAIRGRTWHKEYRAKQETAKLIGTCRAAQSVPLATGPRRVRLTITLAPRQKKHDRDAFDKVLLDSLVRCRLLTDDSDRGLIGRVEVEYRRGPTTITVIELSESSPTNKE